MLHRKRAPRRRMSRWLVAVAICAIALAGAFGAQAGFVDSSAVGGISIDGMGALAMPTVDEQRQLLTARETALEEIPGDLAQFTPMRMVSLKQLDEAVRKHRIESPLPLPQELQFVAGLQRIEYVFVYPDQHDIVIAGPAEGWEIDDLGNVVGVTTRRPVLALDDLIVALRGADETNGDGIFC